MDSIHGSARISLTDRIKFAFNYVEDTWSGATPLATIEKHSIYGKYRGNDKNGNPILVTGATPGSAYIDKNGNHLYSVIDPATGTASYLKENEKVHIMSYASPETRNPKPETRNPKPRRL